MLGYSNHSNFYKAFKMYYGITHLENTNTQKQHKAKSLGFTVSLHRKETQGRPVSVPSSCRLYPAKNTLPNCKPSFFSKIS